MYEQEILRILADAGENGLKVAKIARHVYNSLNSLFETHSLDEIHKYVAAFLSSNSKKKNALVEKTTWGVYRINQRSPEATELLLCFSDSPADDDPCHDGAKAADDPTLPLFADESVFF